MLTLALSSKPHSLSSSQFPHTPLSSTTCHSCKDTTFTPKLSENGKFQERGLEFNTGEAFFRQESATGRDLGVLAASLHKKFNGSLRVLDALCGCGVRSLRYLAEADADFVVANDGNENYGSTIVENLSRVSKEEEKRWVVTHLEANRVMTEYYLQKSFFDFIDVDSFGSDSSFLRSAINALRIGGLLYVTSTDGYSSGGHRPHHSLAAYGAYVRPMPYSNEIGLRMLIGGAAREAAVLGYHITPLFSYYAFHGPVFRVLLRLNRGKIHDSRHYGFIGYCHRCGNSHEFSWNQLGHISCSCSMSEVSNSLVVSGPLWTGPLHDAAYLMDMLNLAKQWEWIGCDGKDSLEKLIKLMVDESDPKLPFGYIKLDEMSSLAKISTPPLKTLMSAIHQKGYAASRSHIRTNAIKTNCPMTECIKIAKELQQVSIS
ncbi:tRNA (guanine(26)-N(2))-dimethyltransferase isoform X2 [Gastrolobium bilobum]|uniref:tRNA (guanine(26)-N(2))-dimethyltransferase isoform X2 n=1 Tax=Gastrolobium bilobum TaxID=150636 RepID=UPI002AB1C1A2|nr:tRNA (guanine(26)-N(2))-dimethyltransferase isoform X2 [Gastrolobium bilobum]